MPLSVRRTWSISKPTTAMPFPSKRLTMSSWTWVQVRLSCQSQTFKHVLSRKQTWMVISISRPSRSQHHLSQTVTKYLFQSSLYEGWLNPFNFSRLALALSWTKSFPTGYEQISIQFSHKLTQHIIPNKSPIDLTKLSEASQRKLPNDWNSIPSN